MAKLTLSIDEDTIAKAKNLAAKKGTSVSGLFSNFIAAQTRSEFKSAKPGRLTREATGIITSPDFDESEVLESALLERHGF